MIYLISSFYSLKLFYSVKLNSFSSKLSHHVRLWSYVPWFLPRPPFTFITYFFCVHFLKPSFSFPSFPLHKKKICTRGLDLKFCLRTQRRPLLYVSPLHNPKPYEKNRECLYYPVVKTPWWYLLDPTDQRPKIDRSFLYRQWSYLPSHILIPGDWQSLPALLPPITHFEVFSSS